jgi:hypothetical protein
MGILEKADGHYDLINVILKTKKTPQYLGTSPIEILDNLVKHQTLEPY